NCELYFPRNVPAPVPRCAMAEPLPGPPPSFSARDVDPKNLVGVLCSEQRQLWLRGQRPPAEAYLDGYAALRDHPDAFTLVYNEFLLREELGESPTADEYAVRFPHFAEQLREQLRLHQMFASETPARRTRYLHSRGQNGTPSLPRVHGYELLHKLGEGGMGVVYKARQVALNRLVALKMIRGGGLDDADVRLRFFSEAEAVARLQHPNIVQIFDIGAEELPPGSGTLCPYFS